MDQNLFNLKLAAKQLLRNAKKAEKNEKLEKAKVKKAMEKGNMEVAKIHAENAIREKTVTMSKVTKSMKGVVKSMDQASKAMNLVQLTKLMEQFEQQFEDLDVRSATMEGTMQSTVMGSMPEGHVDSLLSEIAEEHGLDVGEQLGGAPQRTGEAAAEQDELSARLAKLRSN